MRKLAARSSLLLAAAFTLAISPDLAQRPKPCKPTPKPTTSKPTTTEVELDEPTPTAKGQPKPEDLGPPPQAGQMTVEAAQAKRLFDGEKWEEAALALDRV